MMQSQLISGSPVPFRPTWSVVRLLLLPLLLGLLGCDDHTEIRTYTVAKSDVVRKRPDAQVAGKDQRMLGVIVPAEQSAWFFKMVDDPEKVDKYEADFRSIVESLSFEANGTPQWKLREGWTQQLLQQIVYARLTHQADGISATVTQLPAATGDEAGWRNNVFENVNRWRDQLNLQRVDWASMEPELEEVPKLSKGNAKAYFVSLVGKKAEQGMGAAPFMNAAGAAGAAGAAAPPPRSAPATTQSSSTPAAAASPLKFTAPEGWQPQPASGIRLAAFAIGEGESAASVSVSTASGEADMLVDMWFDQLQLEKSTEAKQQVLDSAQTVQVNGVDAVVYSIGEGSEQAILVAQIPWGERESLFVKMTGNGDVVAAQQEKFLDFAKSLKW